MDELLALAQDTRLDAQWRRYVALRGLEFARNIAENFPSKTGQMLTRATPLLAIATGITGGLQWPIDWERMRIDHLRQSVTRVQLEALRDAPGSWQLARPWIEARLAQLGQGH
jgi:hypothetical protein